MSQRWGEWRLLLNPGSPASWECMKKTKSWSVSWKTNMQDKNPRRISCTRVSLLHTIHFIFHLRDLAFKKNTFIQDFYLKKSTLMRKLATLSHSHLRGGEWKLLLSPGSPATRECMKNQKSWSVSLKTYMQLCESERNPESTFCTNSASRHSFYTSLWGP